MKNGCDFMKINRLKVVKAREFTVSQYQIIANEYLSALQGAQTVITINIAVSVGVMAAMADIISKSADVKSYIIFGILAMIGFITDVASICTIHITKIQVMFFQKQLNKLEKRHGKYIVHTPHHYMGLYITQVIFVIFGLIFMVSAFGAINKIVILYVMNNIVNYVAIAILDICIGVVFFVILRFLRWIYKQEEILLCNKIEKEKDDFIN